jgi:L-ascorbate metabolism protein UlaG (beta-lactamase superfamily)
MLDIPGMRIFIGGDSGYGPHFQTIKEKLGSPTIAIMECGQYNESWRYIHAMPDESAQAAHDLGAGLYLPVHWGKFSLALHPWLEPPTQALAKAESLGLPTAFPVPGQVSSISSLSTTASATASPPWWQSLLPA